MSGYNYSEGWLLARSDLVKKLLSIASTGEVLQYTSESWLDITNRQREVNNVLASMVVNMPEYKTIRLSLRCWTERRGEEWHLYIGRPQGKLQGRPASLDAIMRRSFMPGSAGASHDYAQRIEDQDSLSKFVGTVIALDNSVRSVTASVADFNDEAIAFFTDLFIAHGWTASKAEDGKLLLTRLA